MVKAVDLGAEFCLIETTSLCLTGGEVENTTCQKTLFKVTVKPLRQQILHP